MRADPFSSSVSSSIYSWILPPTKAKAKVAAANQAKPKLLRHRRPNRRHKDPPQPHHHNALNHARIEPGQTSSVSTVDVATVEFEHQDSKCCCQSMKIEDVHACVVEETFVAICDLSQGTTDKRFTSSNHPLSLSSLCLLEHPNIDITHASITTLHNMILVGVLRIPDATNHAQFLTKWKILEVCQEFYSRERGRHMRTVKDSSEYAVRSSQNKLLDDEFKPFIATVSAEIVHGEDNEKSYFKHSYL
ncbi:hypothetical protein BLNAU_24864 [Blattamonas nauphoetae]|uniref:Uncharacterized protein n=1 Tax=Blattamonas nauphoetae TaxID=2049346 RepID=A0ABQ9WQB9_9EUKA|nr:hypothetical protein BLNAU_24864 [Blattamonas nauphoetae]